MALNVQDLRVDTYRKSNRLGGWITYVDVAIRITHLPSGIFIEEFGDRSQHRNKAEAMRKMQVVYDLHPEMFEPPVEQSPTAHELMEFQSQMLGLVTDGQRYRKLKAILATGIAGDILFNMTELYGGQGQSGEEVLLRVYTGMHDRITCFRDVTLDRLLDKASLPK